MHPVQLALRSLALALSLIAAPDPLQAQGGPAVSERTFDLTGMPPRNSNDCSPPGQVRRGFAVERPGTMPALPVVLTNVEVSPRNPIVGARIDVHIRIAARAEVWLPVGRDDCAADPRQDHTAPGYRTLSISGLGQERKGGFHLLDVLARLTGSSVAPGSLVKLKAGDVVMFKLRGRWLLVGEAAGRLAEPGRLRVELAATEGHSYLAAVSSPEIVLGIPPSRRQ